MARTTRKAGKRDSAADRSRPRAHKSGASTAPKSALRKPKPTNSAARKQKRAPASQAASLKRQLQTARQQQQASAEILRAVTNAGGDVERPLQFIAETTARLFGAQSVSIQLAEGSEFTQEYRVGAIAKRIGSAYPRSNIKVGGRNLPGTVVAESRQIHIPDLDRLDPSMSDFPGLPHARAGGARTVCGTPLRREGKAVGALIIFRDRLLPFTADELALQQSFADQAVIAIENARLFNETREALAYQTGSSNVLRVIASSPTDVEPVLKTIVESARELCEANDAIVLLKDADHLRFSAHSGPIPVTVDKWPTSRAWTAGRAFVDQKPVHVHDMLSEEGAEFPDARAIGQSTGATIHTALSVPLLRGNQSIGAILLRRTEIRPFNDKQISLLSTFADQAVIAIQNTKLFRETQEALERQTATSEILGVISRSPTDVTPVFEAIAQTAVRLLGCDRSLIQRCDGRSFWSVAWCGPDGQLPMLNKSPVPIDPAANFPSRAIVEKKTLHLPDWSKIELPEFERAIHDRLGINSALYLPLLRNGECIGLLAMVGKRANAFDAKDIVLAESFRDQALIAIENTRLFNETKEALERQTATADILKVIASSPSDVQPVFAAIAERSNRLIGGLSSAVYCIANDVMHLMAFTQSNPEADAALQASFPRPLAEADWADRIRRGEVVEIADAQTEWGELPGLRDMVRLRGFRSVLFVPLLRDGATIGLISVTRKEVGKFASHHAQLLQTFADQAVIAIENVRLFDEVQARTRDLEESLQQQTATADVLRIISRSVAHAAPVFDTILESCERLFNPYDAAVYLVEGDRVRGVARRGPGAGDWGTDSMPLEGSSTGTAIAQRRPLHFPDLADKADLPEDKRALLTETGGMTVLYAPMISHDSGVGSLVVTRRPKKSFTAAEIGLIQTFADQAVIAIENARLFDEVQARTRELSKSLDDLRAAQDRLVQTEKLASLGQLTAGIAHEIKNPLNFVNNFSSLSAELVDELDETLAPAPLDQKMRGEVGELTEMLKSNLKKVVQHGKRADSIVKSMLQHSREGSGEHRSADINAIVEDSLNLAYHGARAEKSGFAITLRHDLDPHAGAAELYPQEITRALLNLISNGFYAATRRKAEAGDESFEPVLSAATRGLDNKVEIRIRDNGTGIPTEVREKMFDPFFTTKPTGEGTGLGLSMTHDIIVKQHGGTIDVVTEPGAFTEFIVTLPRGNHAAAGPKSE